VVAFLAVAVTVGCVVAAWSRLLHERTSWDAAGAPPDLYAEPAASSHAPEPVAPALHGQLVLAQPLPGGCMGLDCLLTDSPEDEPGWPVHVVAALPANLWLAGVEQELLQHWLAQGDLVSISVSGEPAAPRIRIACRRTTLLLDQQPA
jgi:hypothetical protein